MRLKVLALTVISLGIATSAFADGYLETTMKQFFGSKDKFDRMLSLLKESNQEQGLKAAQDFKDSIRADEDAAIAPTIRELDSPRSLVEKWDDASRTYVQLRIETSDLIVNYIGKRDYRDQLSKVENLYKDTSEKFRAVVAAFMEFGKKFHKICATCQ